MGVCDRKDNQGDREIYEHIRGDSAFRRDVRSYFNFQKKHWDGGWGWKSDDPRYAFPKMLNAVWMLYNSFEDPMWSSWGADDIGSRHTGARPWFSVQTLYNAPTDELLVFNLNRNVPDGPNMQLKCYELKPDGTSDMHAMPMAPGQTALPMAEIEYTLQDDQFQHILGRSTGDQIIHCFRAQGDTGWSVENLNSLLNLVFSYFDPTPLLFVDGSGHPSLHLFHYRRASGYVPEGPVHCAFSHDRTWSVEALPPGTFTDKPVFTPDGTIHGFGLLDNGIIHSQRSVNGSWSTSYVLSDLPFGGTGWDDISVIADPQGKLRVFRRTDDGHLALFRRSIQGEWTIQDLTSLPNIGNAYCIRFIPSAALGVDGTIHVVATTDDYELIYYSRPPGASWSALNLTQTAQETMLFATSMGGEVEPIIFIGPDAEPHVLAHGPVHFFRALYGYLPGQFTFNWIAHDLARGRPGKRIVSRPNPSLGPDCTLSIVGTTAADQAGDIHLIHFSTSRRGLPWHDPDQYAEWAAGKSGCTDSDWRYEPEDASYKDGDEILGYAQSGAGATDRVEMWCPSFDEDCGPGVRAGVMVHEATHIRYGNWKGVFPHESGKDAWYYHLLGEASNFSRSKKKLHTPYQLEAEFLADLAVFPQPWIPAGVVEEAKDRFKYLIENKFTNDVPWTLDEPKPL